MWTRVDSLTAEASPAWISPLTPEASSLLGPITSCWLFKANKPQVGATLDFPTPTKGLPNLTSGNL